jgi:S-adenosylmethionine synthetase
MRKSIRLSWNRGLFDFRPGVFIEALGLKKPDGWCYRDTANYGHFGRVDVQFSCERTDKSEFLKDEAKKFLAREPVAQTLS